MAAFWLPATSGLVSAADNPKRVSFDIRRYLNHTFDIPSAARVNFNAGDFHSGVTRGVGGEGVRGQFGVYSVVGKLIGNFNGELPTKGK